MDSSTLNSSSSSLLLDEDILSFFYDEEPLLSSPDQNKLRLSSATLEELNLAINSENNSNETITDLPPLFPTLDDISLSPLIQDNETPLDLSPPLIPHHTPTHLPIPGIVIKEEPNPLPEIKPSINITKPTTKTATKTATKSAPKTAPTTKKRTAPATKKPSKRPRKKQKVESDFIGSLEGMTSDELILYRKSHSLTSGQERELKNHTRKIKNRESAILSRQRRKAYQDELEDKMKQLEVDNKDLEKQLLKLEAQNEVLKSEFLEFQKMISNSTGLSNLFNNGMNPTLQYAENPALQNGEPATAPAPASPEEGSNKKTKEDSLALVYLMIVLHSFASHFNPEGNVLAKNLLADSTNVIAVK
eukprot:TRINITY_DN8988_c0_g1_i1.p1 TRINITY_DN8988_c0_g1~~TRINITY_DN8988_c0_g1_i1.p1  ORF type:complete len:361 (-),score=64.78 TRINITY_DN8988_c0_g1_i1:215-1297(-)